MSARSARTKMNGLTPAPPPKSLVVVRNLSRGALLLDPAQYVSDSRSGEYLVNVAPVGVVCVTGQHARHSYRTVDLLTVPERHPLGTNQSINLLLLTSRALRMVPFLEAFQHLSHESSSRADRWNPCHALGLR